ERCLPPPANDCIWLLALERSGFRYPPFWTKRHINMRKEKVVVGVCAPRCLSAEAAAHHVFRALGGAYKLDRSCEARDPFAELMRKGWCVEWQTLLAVEDRLDVRSHLDSNHPRISEDEFFAS